MRSVQRETPPGPTADSIEKVARRMIAKYLTESIVNGVEYCGWICQTSDLKSFFAMPAQAVPIEGLNDSCEVHRLTPCPECSIQRALWHTHFGANGEYFSGGDKDTARDQNTGRMGPYGNVDAVTDTGNDVYLGTPDRQFKVFHGRSGNGPYTLPRISPGVNRN